METSHWEYLGLKDNSIGTHSVMDVAIYGENDDLIIAGIGNDDTTHAGLLISKDQGLTWSRSDANLTGDDNPYATSIHSATWFAPSLQTPGLIFAVNSHSSAVFWSQDSGVNWIRTDNVGLSGYSMDWVETEPKRPDHVWAAGYLQRSTDNGNQWFFLNSYSQSFPANYITDIAFGDIGEIYGTQVDRIVRSIDDGSTWSILYKPDSNVSIISIIVDPRESKHVVASGILSEENSKHQVVVRKTMILEFQDEVMTKSHVLDGSLMTSRFRTLNGGRLFFGTDGAGVFEITNLLIH